MAEEEAVSDKPEDAESSPSEGAGQTISQEAEANPAGSEEKPAQSGDSAVKPEDKPAETEEKPAEESDPKKKQKVSATLDGIEPTAKPDEHEKARVLVVEDSPPLRRMLEKILSSDGFIVDTAENGKIAIEMLEKRPFEYSLMMLDIMMPVLDGIKTMATIKKNDIRGVPPVVICSCRSDKETVLLANKLGVAGYILKPFKTEAIVAKVRGLAGLDS